MRFSIIALFTVSLCCFYALNGTATTVIADMKAHQATMVAMN